MTFQAFLIKYGEIGLKGKNRYMFEDNFYPPAPLIVH